MMNDKKKVRHRRTIAIELHKQWRNLERKGDADKLALELKVSKPTIDKALIYGCVHQQILVDGITKYFANRILKEKESAKGLSDLKTNQTQQS